MKNNTNNEMKKNIESGLVNPHISRKNDGEWYWCNVYDRKEKVTYHYLWRQFDAESSYIFDRYGFAIELCTGDEDGNPNKKKDKKQKNCKPYRKFRCCICLKDSTKGMFAKGNKYDTIEEAYADITRLVEISGKAFWAKLEMRDRYWTGRIKDKAALLESARNNKLIK